MAACNPQRQCLQKHANNVQKGAKNMQTGAKNMEKMCKKVQKPGTRKVSGERNRATCIHGALQGSTTLLVQPISNFVLLRAVPQCKRLHEPESGRSEAKHRCRRTLRGLSQTEALCCAGGVASQSPCVVAKQQVYQCPNLQYSGDAKMNISITQLDSICSFLVLKTNHF